MLQLVVTTIMDREKTAVDLPFIWMTDNTTAPVRGPATESRRFRSAEWLSRQE
jgi:hypothetical protein